MKVCRQRSLQSTPSMKTKDPSTCFLFANTKSRFESRRRCCLFGGVESHVPRLWAMAGLRRSDGEIKMSEGNCCTALGACKTDWTGLLDNKRLEALLATQGGSRALWRETKWILGPHARASPLSRLNTSHARNWSDFFDSMLDKGWRLTKTRETSRCARHRRATGKAPYRARRALLQQAMLHKRERERRITECTRRRNFVNSISGMLALLAVGQILAIQERRKFYV